MLLEYRRPLKHLDDCALPHRFSIPQDYFSSQCFEVLDLICGEISLTLN